MRHTHPQAGLEAIWARHHAQWRDAAQVASQWDEAAETDAALLRHRVRGRWWETLGACGITLLVTREYEHLVMAMQATEAGPRVSFIRLPHPSGLVADRPRNTVYVASTRNPNQIFAFRPVSRLLPRRDVKAAAAADPQRPLLPVSSKYFPGSLYIHDLAMIGPTLYANAVGHNAVVEIREPASYAYAWWPRCIDSPDGPIFGRNHLQLNSIAAGASVQESFFSASAEAVSARRPGQRNFPVDKRGVVFSGATREPVARGLTRPHSARLHAGRVWVDNSGYGELGIVEDGKFRPVLRLPGWTRGLCFCGDVAFVGTSRLIPRFQHYAPGLEADRCVCGVHAVDTRSSTILGSLTWPAGNQIFAVDWLPHSVSSGFAFQCRQRAAKRNQTLFYAFAMEN